MVKCEERIFNIEEETIKNKNYRKVVFTGQHFQVVLMSLRPGENIGKEIHPHTDQFFRIEKGEASVMIRGKFADLSDGDVFIVPAGSEHDVENVGEKPLKLYTIYSPPQHDACKVQPTKKPD